MSTFSHQDLPAPTWARVQRVQLIRREIREYLPGSALDLLFSRADVVVEGDADHSRGGGDGRYYATIMVKIPLADLAPQVREPADAATAERVAELLMGDPRVRDRLVALARPRLSRLMGVGAAGLRIASEHIVRVEGVTLHLDGDLTATVRARGRTRR